MAELDVSDIVLDPLFANRVTVVQRPQVVDGYGVVSVPNPVTVPNVVGTLTVASPNALARYPDLQWQSRTYSFITKYPLRGVAQAAGQDYQPDLILWNGNQYIVQVVEPYLHFGAGFVESYITSIDLVDTPP